MPVESCTATVDGESRPGRRWGHEGKCYPCDPDGDCSDAEDKAKRQGQAIEINNRVHGRDGA